ncbi:hypothetical protein MXD62_23240 [Frankia sp. Mgl5]|uniref:hypothetical protein n=1 Tax=Frankia sp. Mgl5 TaxID=2933793 RepID=UPI00200E4190|nr:hypothetical protein [Frankia sp. Mgl5]MCK9930044.1 hypothetical protein [Frankia sp. Mgl5]
MSRRLGARSATSTIHGTPHVEATETGGPGHAPEVGGGPRTARRGRVRARAALATSVAAAAVAAAALSGCASGTDALTNSARTTTNAVSGAVGSVTLRNVYVAGPANEGGSTQIISAVFNGGAEEDSLIGISSPAASSGTAPKPSIIRPGAGNIYIANGSAPTLTGLNETLAVGDEVPVTFTFAKAGSVTLDVPVEAPAPGASGGPVAPTVPAETSASPSGTATPSSGAPAESGAPAVGGTTTEPGAPAESPAPAGAPTAPTA